MSISEGLSEEKKWVRNQINNIHSNITALQGNIEHFENWSRDVDSRIHDIKGLLYRLSRKINSEEEIIANHILWAFKDAERKDGEIKLISDKVNGLNNLMRSLCPAGWKRFEKDCYYLYVEKASFPDAMNTCGQSYSVVADARSSSENEFLGSFGRYVWLGISNAGRNGKWTASTTGISISYSYVKIQHFITFLTSCRID
jgi:hypothetical protein